MLGALLAFLGTRVAILISAPHAIFDDEELYNGTAARELLRGLQLPLEEYLYFPHEGGALVVTILTALVFAVGGTSYPVMKLTPLLASAVTLLIWLWFCFRFLDRRAAIGFALLAVLAPPLVLKSDLMLWGHHNTVCLFIALAWLLLFESRFGTAEPARRDALLAGWSFVVGFGLFFAYSFLPALIAMLVTLQRLEGRWLPPLGRRCLVTFLLGLLPWLLLNGWTGFAGLDVFSDRAATFAGPGPTVAKAWALLSLHLPRSPGFAAGDPLGASYVAGLAALALLAPLFPGGRKDPGVGHARHRGPESAIVLGSLVHVVAFVVLYSLSGFTIDAAPGDPTPSFVAYRYLLQLYPALFVLAAVAASRGLRLVGRHRPLAIVLISLPMAALLVGGASACWNVPRWRALGTSFAFRGFSYEVFGWRVFERHVDAPERAEAVIAAADPGFERDAYTGVSWGIGELSPDAETARAWAGRLPTAYRGLGYEGFGWWVADRGQGSLTRCEARVREVPPGFRPDYYRGVGGLIARRFRDSPARAVERLENVPRRYRAAAFQGAGRAAGTPGTDPTLALSLVPVSWRTPFQAGIAESRERTRLGKFPRGPQEIAWRGGG